MKKHTYFCESCGCALWTYQSPSSAPRFCPDCVKVVRRRNIEALHFHNAMKPAVIVINICEVCGCHFVGKNRYRPYAACGSPDCRLELRRRRGKAVKAKLSSEAVKRLCNNCEQPFTAPNKFVRTCSECTRNREVNTVGSLWWGAPL